MSAIHWFPQSSPQPKTFQFAQNGQYLACNDSNGNALEFDLGAEPNAFPSASNPTMYPVSDPQFRGETPPLNTLSTFYMSGTYTLLEERWADVNNGCAVNQSNAGISVQLVNTHTNPYQVLYYNVHFSLYCFDDGAPGSQYTNCQGQANAPQINWFWISQQQNGNLVWGLDDTLASYGWDTYISDNNPHGLALNLLPQISQIIKSGTYGLDPNLADWIFVAYGFGQATWGNTYMATSWQGFFPLFSTPQPIQ